MNTELITLRELVRRKKEAEAAAVEVATVKLHNKVFKWLWKRPLRIYWSRDRLLSNAAARAGLLVTISRADLMPYSISIPDEERL